MIEAKFGFLQMEKKGVCGDAVELRQTTFGEAPETLDAIDMVLTHGKLMSLVIHPEMFLISHVDQSVVAGPAVGVDDGFQADAARNGLPQRLSATVGDDLGVDRTVALEDAEDDGLAGGAAAPFTTNAARTEVALVDLDFSGERTPGFAPGGDPPAQLEINTVDRAQRQTREDSGFCRRQIQGKSPDQLTKTALGNVRTDVVLVSACKHWRFAILQAA